MFLLRSHTILCSNQSLFNSHISRVHISKSKSCFNVKSSTYYFHMKGKHLGRFSNLYWCTFKCYSVPLPRLSYIYWPILFKKIRTTICLYVIQTIMVIILLCDLIIDFRGVFRTSRTAKMKIFAKIVKSTLTQISKFHYMFRFT